MWRLYSFTMIWSRLAISELMILMQMEGSTGQCWILSAKLAASALHIAGGYSLRPEVSQRASESFPIEGFCGISSQTLPFQSRSARWGRLRVKTEVGFGDLAPNRPCAKSTRWTPGNWHRSSAIAVLQIDAESTLAGGAGCPSAPQSPVPCRRIIMWKEKSKGWFPMRTCRTSLTARLCLPHSSSGRRLSQLPPLEPCSTSRKEDPPGRPARIAGEQYCWHSVDVTSSHLVYIYIECDLASDI